MGGRVGRDAPLTLGGTRGVDARAVLEPGPGPHAVPVSLAELIKRRLTLDLTPLQCEQGCVTWAMVVGTGQWALGSGLWVVGT